ncbi:hypothetical protein [Leptospira sp. GIMC2001]|uniref:hypothetical protein n=1 Tax=Leptospira sp. GIMC2001 TaxID=1513297 RepID=UPI00234928B9|nr:hypothetical protein [Leptospira sp. GIMC2001]WCL48471.1 hypothetical protein O4O04_14320 [Leptospira sp. GIMC2001]
MKKAILIFLAVLTVLYCKDSDKEQQEPVSNSNPIPMVEEKKDPKEIVKQIKKNFFETNEDVLYYLNYEEFPQLSIDKLKTWSIFRDRKAFALSAFDPQSQNDKEVTQSSQNVFSLGFEGEKDEQGYLNIRGETRLAGELKKVHCIEFTKEYTDCKFFFDNIVFDNSEYHPYDGSTNQVIIRSRNDIVFYVTVPQEGEYFPAFHWTGPAKSQVLNESFRRAYREYRKDPSAPPPSKYGYDEEKMKTWEQD